MGSDGAHDLRIAVMGSGGVARISASIARPGVIAHHAPFATLEY